MLLNTYDGTSHGFRLGKGKEERDGFGDDIGLSSKWPHT